MSDKTITVDDRQIELKRPGKRLFPRDGITKAGLIDYYRRIADVALRHYRDRPLTMHRYPDGIEAEGFFQKDLPEHFPEWIERVRLPKKNGQVTHVLANDAATLVYLAEQASITPHLALARADRPDHPDRMVFDLDPSDDDFAKVQRVARLLRRTLERLQLPAFVQTTGSRGLHLVVPLDRSEDFDAVRDFAGEVARQLAEEQPELVTVEQRRRKRDKRVYLDIQRNAYGQTAVAPYAVRARPGAPVATPLNWHEVGKAKLGPQRYRLDNLFRRLSQITDPWSGIARHACSVARARARLQGRA